jgi:5,10-methylenetetrahydromethanopterin reductase
LGVGGSGIREMRLAKERPVRALQEAIELVRALLTGEMVHFSGELFHLDGGCLGFSPHARGIPIFVATHSPQVLRLCGRLSDGVLLGNVAHRDGLAEAVQLVRAGEEAAGREPGSVVIDLRLEACISDDGEAALAAMRRRFAVRLLSTFPHWDYLQRLRIEVSLALQAAAERGDLAGVMANLTDAAVMATALVGSVEQVTRQLGDLLSSDVGRVTIRPYSCAGQDLDATIVAFATRVWPAVVGQPVGSG